MRQEIGRDRHEAVLGELLGRLTNEVRLSEDFVDDDHPGCGLRPFGISQVGRDRVFAADVLHVFGVDVDGRMG